MRKQFDILDIYLQDMGEISDHQYHWTKIAMDEYAKEVAIAFKKWKEDNYWADYYDDDNTTPLQDVPRWSSSSVKQEMLTTEELYNLFISSQTK